MRGGEARQFAGAQQEIGIAGATEAFVADGEGFVEQNAAGRQGAGQGRQKRPMQVIRNDDAGEKLAGQRPIRGVRRAGFEIDGANLGARIVDQIGESRNIPIDRQHVMAEAA